MATRKPSIFNIFACNNYYNFTFLNQLIWNVINQILFCLSRPTLIISWPGLEQQGLNHYLQPDLEDEEIET